MDTKETLNLTSLVEFASIPTMSAFMYVIVGIMQSERSRFKVDAFVPGKIEGEKSVFRDIAVLHQENVLYAACGNGILKITSSGVETWAGNIKEGGSSDGYRTSARFSNPTAITIDQNTGTIFLCNIQQYNYTIRLVTAQGEVSTLAGSSKGFQDGTGNQAQFEYPCGICYDNNDQSLLVCDCSNDRIRRVSLKGEVTSVCNISRPIRITAISDTKFLITSLQNKIILLERGPQGFEMRHLAGNGDRRTLDGSSMECSFLHPYGVVAHEPSNSCFVTEYDGNSIRQITFK